MSLDPLLPVAPARVKALLLPLGKIKAERFASFVERLRAEHVVHLRDISADGRPNRNMFSPLAFPDGAMLYDLITHQPPPSHLALAPFDLYREPLSVIAIADGTEMQDATFCKRLSVGGAAAATVVERNIRALYQELEDLRDIYPKALVHQVIIFDHVTPAGTNVAIPEGLVTVPPPEDCKRTTMKTVMCDISSLLLAEMTTLAKSFEAMTSIDSPGHYSVARHMNGIAEGGPNGSSRRNSQFPLPHHLSRSSSATGVDIKSHALRSGLASIPMSPDEGNSAPGSGPSSPEQKMARSDSERSRDMSRDRVSVQGFGPGGANDRWRQRGKGRTSVVIGSMYLQAGRWSDSLRELSEGAAAARSLNDHIWHGKALELILMNLVLLGWSNLEFQVPNVCQPPQERPSSSTSALKSEPDSGDSTLPKHLRNLQTLLPELLERIVGLYSRISSESLPPLPSCETTVRFSKILSAIHLCGGKLNQQALDIIVCGKLPEKGLSTSPRLTVLPSRQQIVNLLFKAFPSTNTELLTTADRVSILSGIASVLGPLGFSRKKAMVIRELVSVLIGGLVEARTRGAAEAGVHPAAGLVSLAPGRDRNTAAVALDLGEGDIEQGLEAFLQLLCKSYGIVGFESPTRTNAAPSEPDESDEAIVARILEQSSTRFFGFNSIKLNILRACINFAEALPDFNGVLKFSSDLMRTTGSGVAPGPRREDATAMIHRDEQIRLVTNISRTAALVQRIGMGHLTADYWDEFLIRSIVLEPLPNTRTPIPHARSVLPGATASRASQDVNPFIYNPFLKEPDEVAAQNLVAGEMASFRVTLQNTYDIEVDIESIRLCTEGVGFEPLTETVLLGPYRTQLLRLKGRPKVAGSINVTGAIVKIRGCRERRFPIFTKPWNPSPPEKIKVKGLGALEDAEYLAKPEGVPEPRIVDLNVIQEQPLIVVKSTTLPQSSVMILEGERQVFSVTLENTSSTPVDFMLFSFKDSTQAPLQEALNKRDATPAELYEYELILMKRQALRLPRSDQGRNIAPGGEATFEFEILGKPGLTHATIQVDYTYLGVPRDEVTEQFYTRQVSLDLTVTVNASVELTRVDALPLFGHIPESFWERMGGKAPEDAEDYCLLSLDLRNAWPSHMAVHLEGQEGLAVDENILPGKTSRVVMPIKRIYVEDPHEAIPSLNPSRTRQFVVSTSKISPDMERSNREAFWYREKVLDMLRATWRTTSLPKRSGAVELRNIRLTNRMIEAVKVDEVGIDISVNGVDTGDSSMVNAAYVDEFMQLKVHVTNRTAKPMYPLVRLMPALRHRPGNVALDHTRKFAWNGTLQQQLPRLDGNASTDFIIGVTPLCRGEFELAASVEEMKVWEDEKSEAAGQGRPRSDTQRMMDAALGGKQRRMWHSRRPYLLAVRDPEE
ncbi:trafficking protein particle complex subunit 9 [Purpureocillium lavendulum]|uniref:Trafficking protein particle complex subunit 9 n=1 Tax=Purpureocillium lavendulum TaxID=1247861 RepID=A0AB34FGG2_9HYPO|nr:trafficking protein particle complex subunit 9 [Purpureocillium lavendulum]